MPADQLGLVPDLTLVTEDGLDSRDEVDRRTFAGALAVVAASGFDPARWTSLVGNFQRACGLETCTAAQGTVAQALYQSIAEDDGTVLANVQTTHGTDWEISAYVVHDGAAAAALAKWLHGADSAVLRVNAAGILAKLQLASVTDNAIRALRTDDDARRLYYTAVVSRVLHMPWDQALERAAPAAAGSLERGWLTDVHRARLAVEASRGRDGVARWCSASLLGA